MKLNLMRATCGMTLAAMLAAGGVLAGCSSTSGSSDDVETPAATEQATTDESATTRTVQDSDGNEVTIPANVERVAPTMGAFAQVTEMLTQGTGTGKIAAASTNQISDAFKSVFTDYAESNPNNYNSSSVEDLIAANVQVIYGPNTGFSDEQMAQLDAAGITFVKLANIGTVDGLCDSILTIGQILGDEEEQKAKDFVEYYKASLTDAEDRTANLSDAERKSVLQLNISGGAYLCADDTDISAAYYEAAGATNVAAGYEGAQSGQYRTVDAEQIVAWNPDFIITMNNEAKDAILSDAALAGVTAVQNGDVYTCPTALYLWCVRSAEGALMTPWLGTIIYPDLFSDVDMTETLESFYQDWYGAELSDDEAAKILSGETALPASANAQGGRGGQGGGRA